MKWMIPRWLWSPYKFEVCAFISFNIQALFYLLSLYYEVTSTQQFSNWSNVYWLSTEVFELGDPFTSAVWLQMMESSRLPRNLSPLYTLWPLAGAGLAVNHSSSRNFLTLQSHWELDPCPHIWGCLAHQNTLCRSVCHGRNIPGHYLISSDSWLVC